jgi:hypothetical protein
VSTDFAVRDTTGTTVLAVEIKARRGRDAGWAAQVRRNMRDRGATQGVEYLMLVTLDSSYLWHEAGDGAPDRGPDATALTSELLAPAHLEVTELDGPSLELLVSAWLASIVTARSLDDLAPRVREFAAHEGLFDAVRGGAVQFVGV